MNIYDIQAYFTVFCVLYLFKISECKKHKNTRYYVSLLTASKQSDDKFSVFLPFYPFVFLILYLDF